MSKVLIIGSEGQLAYDLKKVFEKKYNVIGLSHQNLDITDRNKTFTTIQDIKPQIVFNTAAYHNTLKCEQNPKISFEVNARGALNVAQAASSVKATVFFFSTDYIFDGTKKRYFEDDLPNPLNVYGASKLAGEILTKIYNPLFYIIRTGWLYGEKISGKGHNFVYLMLEKAKRQREIEVVDDQYGCPTYTLDLATKIKELIEIKAPHGIYHLMSTGSCSWYEFAQEIIKLKHFNVKVLGIKTNSALSSLKRPKYSVLKSKKLEQVKLKNLRHWKLALKDFLNNTSN